MKIIFIGQAPFGGHTLETLLNQGESVTGVITIPDAPSQKEQNPVAQVAQDHEIPLLQTRLLKAPEAVDWVRGLRPDLLVLAFVTSFVPAAMLAAARLGGINYHPSLLPAYRGGSAINWAIINGEKKSGVTIHSIDEGVDTGPILLQEAVDIAPDDTVKSLYFDKLFPLGVSMMAEAVRLIRTGKATAVSQDEKKASFQPVITAADTAISWQRPTTELYNLIRGANPYPGATTTFRGGDLVIFDARPAGGSGRAGEIITITEQYITVATGDGALKILSVRKEGKKKQAAADFIAADQPRTGEFFGETARTGVPR
jgi:methionyl-tRNA formyltransferase